MGTIVSKMVKKAKSSKHTPQVEDDKTILDKVMGRLWKPSEHAEPILAIEVMQGPYKGVVFAYTQFTVFNHKLEDGMVPVKYETTVLDSPAGFVKDEDFDIFTSDVCIAWLGHLAIADYRDLVEAETDGLLH